MRLIDADALIVFMRKGWRVFPSSELQHTCDMTDIDSAPTIDAVPVVRCKDCKFWYTEGQYCDRLSSVWEKEYTSPNDYCSWGERREEVNI